MRNTGRLLAAAAPAPFCRASSGLPGRLGCFGGVAAVAALARAAAAAASNFCTLDCTERRCGGLSSASAAAALQLACCKPHVTSCSTAQAAAASPPGILAAADTYGCSRRPCLRSGSGLHASARRFELSVAAVATHCCCSAAGAGAAPLCCSSCSACWEAPKLLKLDRQRSVSTSSAASASSCKAHPPAAAAAAAVQPSPAAACPRSVCLALLRAVDAGVVAQLLLPAPCCCCRPSSECSRLSSRIRKSSTLSCRKRRRTRLAPPVWRHSASSTCRWE